jgi:hypothetical protein
LPRYCPGNCQFRILNWQDIVLVIAETIFFIKPFRSCYHFWLTRHLSLEIAEKYFLYFWSGQDIVLVDKCRNQYHIMSFSWREGNRYWSC